MRVKSTAAAAITPITQGAVGYFPLPSSDSGRS